MRSRIYCLFCMVLLAAVLCTPTMSAAQIYFDLWNFSGGDGQAPANPQHIAQGQDGNLYGTVAESLGGSGVIFSVTPAGALTVIHTFTGKPDGARPSAGLTLGLDGNFYGSTVLGGTSDLGTVFKVTPSGSVTILYNFTGMTDGAYPYATPVLGNDGNFYGVTQLATAYKITPSGTFTLLGTIPGRSYAPLALGWDGNFYGTTQQGGTLNQGTVFRMTPAGSVSVIYNFDTTHGGVPWAGLVVAADGNFYGTATAGGSGGGGVVFRVTPSGSYKVLHNFPVGSINDGSTPIAGVVFSTDGTFYGSTSSGGANGFGVIFKLGPTGSYTFINQYDKTTGSDGEGDLVQHTNGWVYGLAKTGGVRGDGVLYGLDLLLGTTVKLVLSSGRVGSTVEVLGMGFTGTTAVKFNGKAANFRQVTDTYLLAFVPAGATSGPVKVTTPTGTFTSQTKFLVLPKVVSFTPTSGPVGTPVVITGNSFTGATKVTFGGVNATVFSVDSDTQITATVPSGAQTGKISVTTPSGTGTSTGTFTVT